MRKLFSSRDWIGLFRILFIIIVSIMFYKYMDNADDAYIIAGQKVSQIFRSIKPFIFAIVIAYILSPIVDIFDDKITRSLSNNKINEIYSRTISTLCVYAIIGYAVFSSVVYILPQILDSLFDIFKNSPELIKNGQKIIMEFLTAPENADPTLWEERIYNVLDSLFTIVEKKAVETANSIIVSTIAITSNIILFIFASLISIYLVIAKHNWILAIEKLLVAFFGPSFALRYNIFWRKMNNTFVRYVLGKSLASLILGALCFIGLTIMNAPYVILISAIFAVTNMIPYFGPFIGEIVGAVLVSLVNPWAGVITFIYLFCLQMLDMMIVTPKCVGNILNISPVWIIFSVILGGSLFGIPGMFFGAPIIAVVLDIFRDYIDGKLTKKDSLY
ncbi:MAG: AI-2E family transporter [Peptostreptococcales bacterium]|jgi:predicted PurR-regulated permease PerM